MFEIGLEIVWNWILEQLTWNSDEPGIIFSKLWLIRTSLSAVTTPEPRAQDRLHLIFTWVQVVSVTCPQTPQAPPYHLTSSWPPRRRSFTKAKGTVPLEESLMMETKITVGYYSIVGIFDRPLCLPLRPLNTDYVYRIHSCHFSIGLYIAKKVCV